MSTATGARWPLALILIASLALSLAAACTMPLLDPDEGRNAEVAREMAVGGDLVIPQLAGIPYLDKPPALFWAGALSIRALGPTPLAARLPSIVAGLLTLLLLARAARRAGGARFGWLAAALLAAAPLFAALMPYVIFDLPLTLCVTVVWLGVARETEDATSAARGTGRAARRLAMFLAIALGILLKGPVMLAWAIGGSLGAALVMRSRSPLRWLAWLPGWLIALGLPAIWFALATARFPEYPHYAFLEESLERMTRGTFHRQQPWWFVPAVLVGGTLPWSLATPWSRARFERAAREVTIGARVGLGFILFALVFFTLSRSKLVTYLAPALPPLAWAAAAMWNDRTSETRARRITLAACLLLAPAIVLPALPALAKLDGSLTAAPLARAIAAAGPGTVRYERCYSFGAEYLLGRTSRLVGATGIETTSNYQARYRDTLKARGLWSPSAGSADSAAFIVRAAADSAPPPAGGIEIHRDRRFVAWRLTPPAR